MAHEIGAQAALLSGHHAAMERLHSSRYWKISGKMGLFGKDAVADAGEEDMDALDDASLLRRSGLFDREWYLERYPDVRARKMDPVRHYLKYGAREGRDPNPAFSTRSYLALYPDVASAGVNPLAHYIRHGRREGRGISARTGG
jgi:hypothetical protein